MMRKIGLLGGMSFESTLTYYDVMNKTVKAYLGGSHSARIVMESFDYHDLERLLENHQWDEIGKILGESANKLKTMGAELLVIGANTMHIVAEEIKDRSGLEVVHIADAVAKSITTKGLSSVGLFGTSYTMQNPMYPDMLKEHGIKCLSPLPHEQEVIHRIIYLELIKGIISDDSRQQMQVIAARMVKDHGIEGVILGCTEIPLLIKEGDLDVCVFDTTTLHAIEAVNRALQMT